MSDELDPTAKYSETKKPDTSPEEQNSERVRKFLSLAHERFKMAAEAEAKNRAESLDDLEFRTGKQWPDDILAARTAQNKPCLTMNRLPAILRQVTNQQRRERPAVQINPAGSGASTDIAEIFQGIVRHIEVRSDAEIAYDDAFESMVCMGSAFWRVITEYSDDESDDQEIRIKRIKNQFSVYFDPSSIEPDYSDARFAFIVEDFSIEEYKNTFPESKMASLTEFTAEGNGNPDWASKDSVRVAEYFYVEDESIKREGRRELVKRKVKWAKINGAEILEEREWPGKWIPIIPVLGDDLDVNGKRYLAGMVRDVKDAIRMYNYHLSAATQAVGLAPQAPFVIAAGQMEGFEAMWEQANTRTLSALVYKALPNIPPPERNTAEPPIEAIGALTKQADNDIKAITGIYDASLGQPGPEQSAKAILARKKQGDVSTSNWSDNLARSLRHSGRVLVDLIPLIYDAPRVQRIINPDQTIDHVGVFNSQKSGMSSAQVQGLSDFQNIDVKKIYDIGVGKYDVTVTVGPSYQSQRQEAVASIMALLQAYPNMTPIIGDLLVRQMDIPFAKQIADRLEKTLPPELKDDDDQDAEAKAQNLQQQLMQVSQQNQQLTQHLNAAIQAINTKKVEQDAKVQIAQMQETTKMTLAQLDRETKLAVAEIGAKAQDGQMRAKLEMDLWKANHTAAHDVGTQAADHAHEQTLAAQAAQNDTASQQSDQAHQADMATQAQDAASDQQAVQAAQKQTSQANQ